ncbi:synaptotagmin-A [Malaya genurostris]|uniref:synaptotagmin-A n=1 Tax=Malaya genurostris TaxID=325434 RepID=UPI0026F3D3F3|nr:synaptotagmin-A [Malaya genurostris]XP_058450137.1 synaptotagmin-A [Malaya genurostris]XP_058450138.1 synaptotagmin-A [Malaya genurostris]XP_058450139.1 synaptotagmin-A [Malaya genurostris]
MKASLDNSFGPQGEEPVNSVQVIVYAATSFLIVSLLGLLIYITCSKRYRLNWFEKNLLETEKERQAGRQRQTGRVSCPIAYNIDAVAGTSRYLNRNNSSPLAKADNPPFWASEGLYKANSGIGQLMDSSDEEVPEDSADSSSSCKSVIVVGSMPIAGTNKHVVLSATNPAKPTTSTVKAKNGQTGCVPVEDVVDSTDLKSSPAKLDLGDNSRGAIHMTLSYDPTAGILNVKLIEAQDLQPRDFSGTADPYAKIRLLPDRNNMWQTRVHKKTLNPVFDEDFVFEVRPATIGRRTLEVLLFDFDAYSRHVIIGGSQLALAHVDFTDRMDIWRPLGPCTDTDTKQDLGDLMISLSYLPSAEKLTVVVIKARNLRIIDETRNSSDPYVKVSLYNIDGKRLKKRKTTVSRNTISPVYNEALSFDIARDALKNCSIELQVLHDNLLGKNEVLGKAIIGSGPDARPEDRAFFDELFRNRSATAQWITLSDWKASKPMAGK